MRGLSEVMRPASRTDDAQIRGSTHIASIARSRLFFFWFSSLVLMLARATSTAAAMVFGKEGSMLYTSTRCHNLTVRPPQSCYPEGQVLPQRL